MTDPQLQMAAEAITRSATAALQAAWAREDAPGLIAGILRGELVVVLTGTGAEVRAAWELPVPATN